MSAIVIPRRHLIQPQGRLQPHAEWGDRIVSLIHFSGSSANELVDAGANYALSGAGAFRDNPSGTGLGWDSTTQGYIESASALSGFSGEATLCFWLPSIAASYGSSGAMLWAITAAASFTQFNNTGDSVYVLGDANKVLLGEVVKGTYDRSLIIRATTQDPAIFLDRKKIAGRSKTIPAGAKTVRIGAWSNTNYQYVGDIGSVAVVGGGLSDDESLELADYPWMFYRADPVRFYSLSGGGAQEVSGSASGSGAVSGAISTAIPVGGVVLGLGDVSGSLSASPPQVGGTVGGSGGAAGSITTAIPVAATVLGVASVSGALTTEIRIGGAVLGAALSALSLQTGISVAGLIAGEGAASGGLQLGMQIGGSVLGAALVQGGIATRIEVAGAAVGGGAVSGGLSGAAPQVGGSAAGAGLVVGNISTVIPLTGAVLGQGATAGGITVSVPIGGLVDGVAYIQGAVSTAITLSGGVAGAGTIRGRVDVEVVRVSAPRVFSENTQSARRPRAVQTSRPRQQWP